MPSRAYWLERPSIMAAEYQGRLAAIDFENVMNTCLLELQTQQLYFLVDFEGSMTMPLKVTLIPSLLELINHKNTMGFAFVHANRFAKMSIPTFVRKPFRFFEGRETGLAYLRDLIAQDQIETSVPD